MRLDIPQFAAIALVHLGAPLLLMRGNASLYLQYRPYTLAPVVMVGIFASGPPWLYLVPEWYAPGRCRCTGVVRPGGLLSRRHRVVEAPER